MSGNSGSDDTFLTGKAGAERDEDFLIVGMGASAGGITAFKQFFERVPAESGMAYVVILHLSPDHDSKLAEVLQASAAIPVAQVVESIKIEPNHVYVIPPNKSLSMKDGTLALSEIKGYEERRAPVDIFFRTLATEHTTRAVSVILSGTGANGSMGVKRVKEMGGIIIVQDPREAEYSDMPRNSIATGLVDHVLPVAEIPAKIIAYKENLKEVRLDAGGTGQPEADEQALRDIFTQLRVRTRHDFSNYKRSTVLRRLERRINVHELAGLADYARFMRAHKEEAQALLKDLLISVTNFFRDAEAFRSVEQKIIPELFVGKGAGDYVRVWVAGCATGEEAYSMTMMLLDYAATLGVAPSVQVFATDIDEQAVSIARDGFYTEADVADVPPERLRRYFTKDSDGYRVRRELRETVLFAQHNLIRDPPFSHLDMISCRNLLIYLNRTAQERVMQIMHFALNPGGYLFLGTSESVDGAGDLFVTVDKEAHAYQGRTVTPRLTIPLPDVPSGARVDQRLRAERAREERVREGRLTYSDLHHRLIEQYGPPSVVVNEEYTIVHLSERAGRYLQFTGGDASLNLLEVIRPELRLELRTALYQAARNRTNVETRGIATRLDDHTQTLNLMVRPVLREDDTARGFFLILFEETTADENAASDPATATIIPVETATLQLEEELLRVKAQLRSSVEQYETQAEEMKASNEELQAMNEELRSSTEELETSKEELQSLNEELHTVNQELKVKIEELSHANNDFRNLMFSTDIGTIFLDRTLHIKLFTPRARDIFKLIPADVGRPLSDISSNLVEDGLVADVEAVLDRLQPIERETGTRDGRFHLMRIVPYRTSEDRIEGVVLNFVDISERKRAEEAVRSSEERLQRAIGIETVGVLFFNNDIEIVDCNEAFLHMTGFTRAEIRAGGLSWEVFTPEEFVEPSRRAIEELNTKGITTPYEKEYLRKDGSRFWALFAAKRISESESVEFVIDITEQKRTEAARFFMASIVESSQDSIITVNFDGDITSWNRAAEMLYGYSAAAAIGKPLAMLSLPENLKEMLANADKVRHHETMEIYDTIRVNRDGRQMNLEVVLAPVKDAAGRVIGVSTIARDVTESRRAEEALRESDERLRLLVESVKDYAIFMLDNERRVRSWNPGAKLIFGYAESEIIGQSGDILFTPEDRERGAPEEEARQARATGRAADERWHIRKDGTRFYASGVLAALSDGRQGFAKIARDLTQEKRAEEDLQRAHDALEERVRERTAELLDLNQTLLTEVKERTAAERRARKFMRQIVTAQEDERRNVARDLHDHLGQQLTGLRIKLENHKHSCGDEPSHWAEVEQIQAIAERLDADVDFLAWELRPASLDELGLSAALANYIQEWSQHFDIPAEFHTTGMDKQRLPPEVEINLYRIAQEALNNVSKHAAAKGVDVLLERRDHHVELIVEDDGKGFKPDGIVKPDGKRIGLLNMSERAAFVGGALEIESAPGEGTTVFARVPIGSPRGSGDGDGDGGA